MTHLSGHTQGRQRRQVPAIFLKSRCRYRPAFFSRYLNTHALLHASLPLYMNDYIPSSIPKWAPVGPNRGPTVPNWGPTGAHMECCLGYLYQRCYTCWVQYLVFRFLMIRKDSCTYLLQRCQSSGNIRDSGNYKNGEKL